jgi:hypothetical protein
MFGIVKINNQDSNPIFINRTEHVQRGNTTQHLACDSCRVKKVRGTIYETTYTSPYFPSSETPNLCIRTGSMYMGPGRMHEVRIRGDSLRLRVLPNTW